MYHQGFGVAHICQMGKNLQGLDEFPAGFTPAFQFKTEHRPATFRQQLLRQFVIPVCRQFRVGNVLDGLVIIEAGNDFSGIGYVFVHSQRKRFDSLQDIEGIGGAQGGAEISQTLAPGPVQEGVGAEILGKIDV